MVNWEIAQRLCGCFNRSFINGKGEFIAQLKGNQYFILHTCETELDVKCKVLEWLSAGAYKTQPYKSKKKNDEFHTFMLNGINQFLGTKFDETDIEQIYTYLGNACNHKKTVAFIESGYCMDVLTNHKAANIEKTVTTQQILELCKSADDVGQNTKDIVKEALELKIAKEQGLILELPCKVDDELFWFEHVNQFRQGYVTCIFIEHDSIKIEINSRIKIDAREVNSKYFLTKKEAEQMKENGHSKS